jgi:hypothetical protein
MVIVVGCCYTGTLQLLRAHSLAHRTQVGERAIPVIRPFDTGCLPLSYSGNPGVKQLFLWSVKRH